MKIKKELIVGIFATAGIAALVYGFFLFKRSKSLLTIKVKPIMPCMIKQMD
jgi:hypothetical protein